MEFFQKEFLVKILANEAGKRELMLIITSQKANSKSRVIAEQSLKRIRVNNLQKCLTCMPHASLSKGKLVRFPNLQSIEKKYSHSIDCTQREKF